MGALVWARFEQVCSTRETGISRQQKPGNCPPENCLKSWRRRLGKTFACFSWRWLQVFRPQKSSAKTAFCASEPPKRAKKSLPESPSNAGRRLT
jgi:hypothetical protein